MNRKQLVKLMILVLAVAGVFMFSACQKKEDQIAKSDPENGIYTIYYKNAEGTELVSDVYETDTESGKKDTLVKELIKVLQSQKEDDPSVLPAVSANLEVINYNTSLMPYLTIDFAKSYSSQSNLDEILCRSALVMTLTQIEGVQYIEIQVEGQPLLDSTQKPVGKLSADKIMTDINGNMFSRQKSTLILYFASQDGKELVEVERTVLNDSTMAMEKLVMNLLLEGPADSDTRAVIPDTVSILDISIRSGTCYVNFDSAFLTDTMDLPPEIIIYSIVNSLSELTDVSQVQIMVNGSSDVKFKESFSLSEPLVKDLNYLFVQEEESKAAK